MGVEAEEWTIGEARVRCPEVVRLGAWVAIVVFGLEAVLLFGMALIAPQESYHLSVLGWSYAVSPSVQAVLILPVFALLLGALALILRGKLWVYCLVIILLTVSFAAECYRDIASAYYVEFLGQLWRAILVVFLLQQLREYRKFAASAKAQRAANH